MTTREYTWRALRAGHERGVDDLTHTAHALPPITPHLTKHKHRPCLRPVRGRRSHDDPAVPMRESFVFGSATFGGGGHHRLLPVPTLPHVFIGLAGSRGGGVLVLNLEGNWWRWLPGPLRSRAQRERTYTPVSRGGEGAATRGKRIALTHACNPCTIHTHIPPPKRRRAPRARSQLAAGPGGGLAAAREPPRELERP